MRERRPMHRNLRGFTLIELMIVMIILAILATFIIGTFTTSQKKSRDVKRKNDLRQIGVSLEAYNNDKGRYPDASNGMIMGCQSGEECAWGSMFADSNNTIYMSQLPNDPTTIRHYVYVVSSDNRSYQIYAALENTLDADIPKDAENKYRVFTDLNCGTSATMHCNFGIASSNTRPEVGRSISYE